MGQLQDVRLRSKKGAWIAFAILVLGGIAAGTWSLTRSPPAPNGVLVHVEGCGEGCREALFAYAERLLGEHGFEAVPDIERRFPTDLSEVLSTARAEGAAHALFLKLGDVERREGAGGEGRMQALVEAMLDVASAEGETMRISRQLSVEGEDLQHALKLGGDAVLEAAIDPIAAFLAQSDAVQGFLAGDPTPREVETRERLERVRGGADALHAARSDFDQRCRAARETAGRTVGLDLRCSLRTSGDLARCPRETLVAVLDSGVVVHAASRRPRFRLGRRADVQRSRETFDRLLHWDPAARAYYMAHAPWMRPNADALGPHRSVHVEVVMEPSGGQLGSALVTTRGSPRRVTQVLYRVEPPVRIGLPHLAPDGRSLVFTRQEHGNAAPELMWMLATPGATPRAVTPFGAFGRFVERPAEDPASSETFLVVTIAGAQNAPAPAAEAEESAAAEARAEAEAPARSEEEQLFDDLMAPDEEERANLHLPTLTHQAVMRVGRGGPALVTRVGGEERPVQGVLGAIASGLVVASASQEHGCTLGIVDWETWEPTWVAMPGCLESGAVAQGPRGAAIYGTMRVAEVSDPVVGDAEIVRVDLSDGRLTQLTHDGVEDADVMAHPIDGGVRLAFERRPAADYARFAPSFVCTALAPTEPGEPFTPRPPPATPPPPESDGSPVPP